MTTQHTPAPWHICRDDDQIIVTSVQENDEMLVDVCSVYGGNENNVELQEANAHLIAAAPEMLWALEQVAALGREASNSDGQVYLDESNFLYILEIAIAKAKGKTSGE